MTQSTEIEFQSLIEKLSTNSHGVQHFSEVKDFLKGFSGTEKRVQFLEKFLTRPKVVWESVKSQVWQTEKEENENRFFFIQGDIIETTFARGIGSALLSTRHPLWLVLSPDCDCIRASYVKLAPIFAADRSESQTYSKYKNHLSLAFAFKSNRLFPVGKDLFENGADGYFIDSSEPYFLASEDKESVTVHYSMQPDGWHLLNGFLKESETRANLEEGKILRRVL